MNGAFVRHTRRNPCPVCQKPDWCRTFDDGWTECMRVESPRPSNGGWQHRTAGEDDPDWRDGLKMIVPREPLERPLDYDLIDPVYRRLLELCPLSAPWRDHLHRRGLTDAEIAADGYATLPERDAWDGIAATLVAEFGPGIVGQVPGLLCRDGSAAMMGWPDTLLIPVLDETRRIVGLRVRHGEGDQRQGTGKYSWFSSQGTRDGRSPGAPAHLALPPHHDKMTVTRIVVTEGEIKANIAARKLGLPVISVPGVSITGDVVRMLRALGATDAWIAYDADAASNPTVAFHEGKLIADVTEAGYVASRLTWPVAYKGLDDALGAGALPIVVPTASAAPCAEALAEKDRRIADLERQLAELSDFHVAYVAANRSPHMGQERSTAAAMIVDLSTVPVGEWKPMPHKRIAEQAGISERAVPRQLKTAKPVIADVVEIKTEWVPETVDAETGEVRGGHKMTYARLKTDRVTALRTIATGIPEKGHKNNHGGKRLPCPDCGDVGRVRSWTDRCAGCGMVLETGETRIRPGDCQDVRVSLDTATEPSPTSGDRQVVMFTNGPLSETVLSSHDLASSHNDEPDWLADAPEPWFDESPADSVADAWLNAKPLPRTDLTAARSSLAAADHAPDGHAFRKARSDLAADLAPVAQSRGRVPVPKPSAAEPITPVGSERLHAALRGKPLPPANLSHISPGGAD